MPQMTNSQARVIDPVYTEVARGYQQNALVGMALFPRVPVMQRGGRVITFDKAAFMQYANMRRAPGQSTRRVQFGHAGAPYALEDYSLEGQVPIETQEEAAAVPGINMAMRTINGVQDIIANRLEIAQAALATNASLYAAGNKITLTSTAQWSDLANSDPMDVVETAKEAIRTRTGKRPNVMVMGAAVMAKLKVHSKVLDRIKYTGRDVPTPELLASLFGVQRVLVGDAIYTDATGAFVDVWGKNVVLAYTELGTMADMGLPSYGYTYRLQGAPFVEVAYQDRNAKSDIYPVTDEVSPVMAAAISGYLISAAVA